MSLKQNRNFGYNTDTYNLNFGKYTPILLKGTGPKSIPKFNEEKHPIPGTVQKTQIDVYYKDLGHIVISLPANYSLPQIDDLQSIKLIDPLAFIDRKGYLYVKASGIIPK